MLKINAGRTSGYLALIPTIVVILKGDIAIVFEWLGIGIVIGWRSK